MIVRDIIKKSSFSPIKKVGGKEYRLMWGKKDVVNKTFQRDSKGNFVFDLNGRMVAVGENTTDYCICSHETVRLPKNISNIVELVKKGKALGHAEPTMEEWDAWAEVFVSESQRLDFLKERLHEKIMEFGSGKYDVYGEKAVDDFSINGEHHWLDKNTRAGLTERFNAEIAAGKSETTLWLDGKSYTLPLKGDNSAPKMKSSLELYASECYDNTQKHVAKKNEMTTIREVISYDWTTGYPKKLSF